MNILDKIRGSFKNQSEKIEIDTPGGAMTMQEVNEFFARSKNAPNLSDITYYTCIKMLSESIGKMTIKFYQNTENGVIKAKSNQAHLALKNRPNPYMTPAIFWSTVEYYRNHYGNAYVWIRMSRGKVKDLWILQSQCVEIVIDDGAVLGEKGTMYYKYIDPKTSENYTFNVDSIMHFKTSITEDGITGMPVQVILLSTIEGNKSSQIYLNNLYKSGLTSKAVLEYTGDLDQKARERLRQGFENFASGADNAGKIIPVPLGMKLTPLNITLSDSQFFELRQYSSLQIAAAFGIKPNHINNYENSSYSSSESQNISFYVDTLLFILNQYEQELTYKLLSKEEAERGFYFKFNVNSILRADLQTQINSLSQGINNGIYTINQTKEFLDLEHVDGGDMTIVNGNYIPLKRVGDQYNEGGVANETESKQ